MGVGAGWYYDSEDGDVVHQNLAESLANVLVSYYHGPYATEADAIAHAGVAGPPGTPNEPAGQQLTKAAGATLGSLLPGWTSDQWRGYAFRALKIISGVALIIVGVVKLTHVQLPSAIPVPV